MAKKKMTAKDLKAIDWAGILTKLVASAPEIAAFIAKLLASFQANQGKLKATAASCADCPQEIKDACCEDMDRFADYVLSRVQLHEAICGTDCDTK